MPFVVFKTGGNFTYLQLGLIGTIVARVIVGYWLVPAYYKKEIYSPYDYMENQLGIGALILIASWCLHHIKVEAKSKEQSLIFLIGIALMFWLNIYGFWIADGKTQILAFPWYIPLGSLTAFSFGYLLGEQKTPVYSTSLNP